jgi:hypothetical protein
LPRKIKTIAFMATAKITLDEIDEAKPDLERAVSSVFSKMPPLSWSGG